jgi:hypothetical protein
MELAVIELHGVVRLGPVRSVQGPRDIARQKLRLADRACTSHSLLFKDQFVVQAEFAFRRAAQVSSHEDLAIHIGS